MDIDKKYWLAFNAFFLIGPKKFALLLKYFGSAKKAWEAQDKEIQSLGLGEITVKKLLLFRRQFSINQYLDKLLNRKIQFLTLNDEIYPRLLKEIPDPPPVLYLKTEVPLNRLFLSPAIAIVGTRNISAYGRIVTQRITEGLVDKGITIVSGLARGVDVCAHQTTLENGGKTIAVLGSGIDRIYPAEHLRITGEIVKKGAVVSEFPLQMPALPGNFPIRNRIISGLSLGVVVTEAAGKSGTLITTSYAGDQGREVFAVPGPITSINSFGTSELLKKGAKLVTEVNDILEEFPALKTEGLMRGTDPNIELTDEEKKILKLLYREPLSLDELVRISQSPAGKVLSLITVMELKGILKKEGDIVYSKINI